MKIEISKEELYMLLDAISDKALELGKIIINQQDNIMRLDNYPIQIKKFNRLKERDKELHKIYMNWPEEESE